MKSLFQSSLLAVAVAAVAGCSMQPKNYYHAGEEAPPEFVAGPMALLFTNVDGFSAKLVGSSSSSSSAPHTVSGDFLGREGSLIFQPARSKKSKKSNAEGGMFFIWNEKGHAGYVLSDPLQGYAPASTPIQATNVVFNTAGATEAEANGHACRQIEAVVQSSDGSSARFKVWQALDAKHFPIRIQTEGGARETTLNFFELRLELPPAPLFGPPDGFVKFDSPVSMMNELIIRQNAYSKQYVGKPIEINPAGGPSTLDNWRPAPSQ